MAHGLPGCSSGCTRHDAEQDAKQSARQEESDLPRTFVPAATRVRDLAREVGWRIEAHLAGLAVLLSRHLEQPVVSDNGSRLLMPQHSLEAEAAMSAELVACTLGHRDRPELLPDMFTGAP